MFTQSSKSEPSHFPTTTVGVSVLYASSSSKRPASSPSTTQVGTCTTLRTLYRFLSLPCTCLFYTPESNVDSLDMILYLCPQWSFLRPYFRDSCSLQGAFCLVSLTRSSGPHPRSNRKSVLQQASLLRSSYVSSLSVSFTLWTSLTKRLRHPSFIKFLPSSLSLSGAAPVSE